MSRFAFLGVAALVAIAQTVSAPAIAQETGGSPQATRAYIARTWATLTRSNTGCETFQSKMVDAKPAVYVPQGENLARVAQSLAPCNVEVLQLPQAITQIGDLSPRKLAKPGLLYLPHPYVVPGGKFNEMYGWDSYFILRGLIADGRTDLASDMVENFFYEIDNYGGILNANRTVFLSRSQPPFLTSMVRALYTTGRHDRLWLKRAYGYAVREHALWLRPEHLAGNTGLARYWDYDTGPTPELGVNNPYYLGVAAGALTSQAGRGYFSDDATYTLNVCTAGAVCAPPQAIGLSQSFFAGDRAMRESGFDVSFRFGPYSGRTQYFAPVCLNSLLFKEESDLAWMAKSLGLPDDAAHWQAVAQQRKAAINKYLWNADQGTYFDYDTQAGHQSAYLFASTFYPLWAGLASADQATALLKAFKALNRPGGIMTSDVVSGAQWDAPYGWAPLQLITAEGFSRYGYAPQARQIATEFNAMIDENFARDATIHEKYNVETRSSDVKVVTGYADNMAGFGWTNGVYLVLSNLENSMPPAAH